MRYADEKLVQLWVDFWHEIEESSIPAAGSHGVQLFQIRCRLKLQFRVRILLPESVEGIRNNPVQMRLASFRNGTPAALNFTLRETCPLVSHHAFVLWLGEMQHVTGPMGAESAHQQILNELASADWPSGLCPLGRILQRMLVCCHLAAPANPATPARAIFQDLWGP